MSKLIALGYSRVSTLDQVRRGSSIPFQKEKVAEKAKELGYILKHQYSDDGISGKSTNRKDYEKLISDIDCEGISAIIFYELSRTSRDLYDLLCLQELTKEKGIKLVSVTENFDLETDEGDFSFKLQGLLNERYRKEIKRRVRAKMYDKAKKGEYCGGQPPFGYDAKEKKYVINAIEAPIIKKMYSRFEQEPSFRGLTVWLNEKGYKTKRGESFAQSTIKRLLTNPLYKGYPTFGKRPSGGKYAPKDKWITGIKGNFEPTITEEQFDRVQILIKNKRREYPQRKYGVIYLLSGLARCECGSSLVGYSQIKRSSDKLYKYYRCHHAGSKGTCDRKNIRKDDLELAVINEVTERIRLYFKQEEVEKYSHKEESSEDKLIKAKDRLGRLQREQGKLIGLYTDENILKSELDKQAISIKQEIEEAETEIIELQEAISPKNKKERLSVWEKVNRLNGEFDSLSEVTQQSILRQIIKSVISYKDGSLELELYEV